MAKNNKRPTSWATLLFYGVLVVTVLVYVLRGFAVLSMLPGGVIWFLIILSIAAGVLATLVNLRRSY
jgi:hypothetical protein